jgi:ABC-2 type transport system ATP-binding protein
MICLREVTKRFGPKEALRAVNLTLDRGEVVGLIGHNGAGKSTTLRLMAGIIERSAGEILRPPDFQARIGYLRDEPFAFDYLTGREMLYFTGSLYQVPAELMRPRIEWLLRLFELEKQADHLLKTYSRGMKRKTALIGSLLHEPAYWLLDEPTESLDPAAIRTLRTLIGRRRSERCGILVSTHQLAFVESLCDRVILLHQGRLVFSGTLEELRRGSHKDASLEDIYFDLVAQC